MFLQCRGQHFLPSNLAHFTVGPGSGQTTGQVAVLVAAWGFDLCGSGRFRSLSSASVWSVKEISLQCVVHDAP